MQCQNLKNTCFNHSLGCAASGSNPHTCRNCHTASSSVPIGQSISEGSIPTQHTMRTCTRTQAQMNMHDSVLEGKWTDLANAPQNHNRRQAEDAHESSPSLNHDQQRPNEHASTMVRSRGWSRVRLELRQSDNNQGTGAARELRPPVAATRWAS